MKCGILVLLLLITLPFVSCEPATDSVLEGKWRYVSVDADGREIKKEWSFEGRRFHLDGGNFERFGTFLVSNVDQNRLTVIFDYEDPDAAVPRANLEVLYDEKNQLIYVNLEGPYNRVE